MAEVTPVVRRTRPITDLVPADFNPRRISPEALAGLQASISRWGLVQEIVVNRRSSRVVGGHQRLKALAALGATEAPVCEVDLDEIEEKALNVALNSDAISGEFTADLGPLLEEIRVEIPDCYDAVRLGDLEEMAAQVTLLDDPGKVAMPDMPQGDRAPFQQITFTLSDEQARIVKDAIGAAKEAGPFVDTGNENSNGNALARIAEAYRGGS